MTVRLQENVYEAIQSHGEEDYPYECCGFLIGVSQDGKRIVREIRAQRNERENSQETRYFISPQEFQAAERYAREQHCETLGIYHSHPDHPARPSQYDLEHAWPWYAYLILSVSGGTADELRAWQLRDDRSAFEAVDMEIVSQQ
ncbi:MAG TPA: M67 family metallopeptidase [bacterium]|nr:M67 family metallopeptidase [bacterium]